MTSSIRLTDKEAALRRFLLDTSAYVGASEHRTPPQLRITGGWVRDKLLGSTSHDIDIGIDSMTGYPFANFIRSFLDSAENDGKYPTDIMGGYSKIAANPEKSKHLETATTRIMGFDLDFVNLRKEVYSDESRNPQMEFGTPEEDAFRRDSTINALFYNLQTAEIEDLTGRGMQDLGLKIIKTPLRALKTFTDDPLRILRSVRFSSRLGFRIASEDEEAMYDEAVQKDFRIKVSRERVGVEITKMLQGGLLLFGFVYAPINQTAGPDPYAAVCLIDRLKLYNIIFTRFTNHEQGSDELADTSSWNLAYDQLEKITKASPDSDDSSTPLVTIAKILLPTPKDQYLAWIVCCFVPWARKTLTSKEKKNFKPIISAAAAAAREGIKAENEIRKIVEGAAINIDDIDMTKNSMIHEIAPTTSKLKRKSPSVHREIQGKAIRRWGSQWRSSVMYALLVKIAEEIDPAGRFPKYLLKKKNHQSFSNHCRTTNHTEALCLMALRAPSAQFA